MLPINYCRTLHDIGDNLEISPETVWALVKTKKLCKKRRNLKPHLTKEHKENCLHWIQSFIKSNGYYYDFYQHVYINEKWFVLVEDGNGYYLAPDKLMSLCSVQHKKHITKVMFLSAVACPRIVPLTGELWDGKSGIWAFAKAVEAKRSSKNRLKGTIEWRAMQASKEKVREMLLEQVFPAINKKWPKDFCCSPVIVQQDNVLPHILSDDPVFRSSCACKQLKIELVNQPAQLLDLNVNNLGLFCALDCLRKKIVAKNAKGLI